ncbi:hypothetical protein FG05_35310 [Fusarium graminearum]|nr:hypothetical protein FG05_35310 [Fusarium graminearum]
MTSQSYFHGKLPLSGIRWPNNFILYAFSGQFFWNPKAKAEPHLFYF